MANTYVSKQPGGHLNLSRLLLVLFMADLQPGELHGSGARVRVAIVGPDYVTVDVPASVACEGNCLQCTYSMSLDGQAAQGQANVLAFTVDSWVEAITVTCTATNDATRENAVATKRLRVLAGPANVSITGPDLINASMSYTYSCHAYCQPSCAYAWKTGRGVWIGGGGGNMISITPEEMHGSVELTCKASNNASGMFVSASREITVTWSDHNPATCPEETWLALLLAYIISAACEL